jgi:formylglycine-generating enzyme required for sulfatase activity
MIEASPSRCTPEQWTAEQAARAMGVVDEADGEALGVEGAAVGESGDVRAVGREEPKARRMRWAAGGTALAVVAVAAWWSGAGNRNSREILAHAGADGALIAGERTPNSGPGDFNSSNGSSHMKIQTTAAALLGAAAVAFQAQAGDAVQWRVEDGGNGHWYAAIVMSSDVDFPAATAIARQRGGYLFSGCGNEFDIVVQITDAMLPQYWLAVQGSQWLGPWIGIQLNGNIWGWSDDNTCAFDRWDTNRGQPDSPGVGGETVAFLYSVGAEPAPVVHDVTTSRTTRSLLIEWSADCNSDGIVDYGQILSGQLADANTNGIPDLCECATHPELGACRCVGDIVTDGIVNGADLGTLLAYWGLTTSVPYSQASDINVDGRVDGADLGRLLSNWGACQYPGITVPAWAILIEALPDPAVVTNPALRTAIAATGLAWRVRDTATQIEMLLVPPGAFEMGCVQGSTQYACTPEELPVHPVALTAPIYLGRYEVTQTQWMVKMGSNPSYFQGPSPDRRPVEYVSWNSIQNFLELTGTRLPTEAEWEYACRAGTRTPLYNGSSDDSTLGALAWYVGNCTQTQAIGGKAANALGFHDMLGNVWEWVRDGWGSFVVEAQVNPTGPEASESVVRGGCYADGTNGISLRSSFRYPVQRNWADRYFGFRVARNP